MPVSTDLAEDELKRKPPAVDSPTQIDPDLATGSDVASSATDGQPRAFRHSTGRASSESPALKYSVSRSDGAYGDRDGDELAGRYQLRGVGPERLPLGLGAFGEVWQAYDRQLEREVALKILKQRMCGPAMLLRFELEKQLVARMEHTNIAKVFEAGTLDDGRPFLSMELIRGQTLLDFCRQRRLSIPERLRLFVPICRAVQHAHERFVLHRDLKPSNIMVLEHDGQAVPKVIDFGIAKVIEEGEFSAEAAATVEGSLKGTPAYMSPEQTRRSEELTVRSDVYTLGIILFELLTADTPLSHQRTRELDFFQLVGVICHEPAVAPSIALPRRDAAILEASYAPLETVGSLVRQLRGDLDVIVLRALEKEPERRYESAAALAVDLERHLAHEPILARPPSLWYRTAKFLQRHQAVSVAAIVVLAALIMTAAISTKSYFTVSDSLAREKRARQDAVSSARIARQQRSEAEAAKTMAQKKEGEARTARDAAMLARDESEDLLNYMLYDLRQQLEPLGRSRLLAGVSEKAEQYFARQPRLTDDDALERNRAVMFYNRGYILLAQGDVARAVAAFEAARKAMAQRALAKEETLRRLDYATASHGLGLALRAAGRPEEARPIFEESLTFLRARQEPPDPALGRLLAATLEQLGELQQRAGQAEAAEALFLEQESRLRELKKAAPDDLRTALALAVACEKLGSLLQQSGHPGEALPKFQEEVELLRKLSGDQLDDLVLRRSLAVALEKLGNVLLALKRPEEAKKQLEERLRESELLVRVDPRRLDFRRDVAVAHQRLATAQLDLHNPAGAREHALADLQLTSSLAADYPRDLAVQGDLASSKFQMGFLLLKSAPLTPARAAESRGHLEQSAQILRKLAADQQIDERGKAVLVAIEKALADLPPAAGSNKPSR